MQPWLQWPDVQRGSLAREHATTDRGQTGRRLVPQSSGSDQRELHAQGGAGIESHFKVIVVSQAFEGQRLLGRHRQVNGVLAEELAGAIHALALHTYTEAEWQAREQAPKTPGCVSKSPFA